MELNYLTIDSNHLTRSKKFNTSYRFLLAILSFLIPLVLLLVLFSTNNFYPFSKTGSTILMIDGRSQYIAYFRYLKSVLENNESLIYTYSKTFGGDFLSIFSYYLASPFNLLLLVFSYEEIPTFLLTVSILKMCFSGLNMYLFLRFVSKKCSLGYLIPAISYALCSYAFVYQSNVMWLDGVMILPLVALGLEYIFEKKHYWIYVLSLAYALFSSWYIGAMICMFSVLFFIYKLIATSQKKQPKEKLSFFLVFAIASLLAGFLSSSMWLTAFLHLSGTKASSFSSLANMTFLSFSKVVTSFFSNSYSSSDLIKQNSGYGVFFTSINILVFLVLFFFNKGFSLKERIAAVVLVFFYCISYSNSSLNTIMHGFKDPTWFPTRYSFILSFLICFFGGKEISKFKDTPLWSMGVPLLLSIVFIVVAVYLPLGVVDGEKVYYEVNPTSVVLFYTTYVLALLSLLSLLYTPKYSLPVLLATTLAIIPLTSLSSYQASDSIIKTNLGENEYQKYPDYQKDCAYESDFDNIKNYDSSFYRMENTFLRPGSYNSIDNDPMFYDYNGLSHYSSSENKDVENYMTKIGFHYNGYFEKYGYGSTVSMNSFLDIQYLIDDTSSSNTKKPLFVNNYPYSEITSLTSTNDNIRYLKNELTLPIGFKVNPCSSTFINQGVKEEGKETVRWFDHFEYQNEMYKAMTDQVVDLSNEKKNIFTKIPVSDDNVTCSDGLTYTENEYGDRIYNSNGATNTSVTMTFTVPDDAIGKNLYFCLKDLNDESSVYVVLDSKHMESNYWSKGIQGFNDTTSHKHILKFSFPKAVKSIVKEEIYYEDTNILNEYVDAINEGGIKDITEHNGLASYSLKGTFDYHKTYDDDLFLFTLPYEKGISIYIDGKKKELLERYDIFSACQLTGLEEGTHTIEIVYSDTGFKIGIVLTIMSVFGIVGYYVYPVIKRKIAKKRPVK